MKKNFSALASGLIFAVGLGISGMTDTSKVTGFLNLAGDWDPSLAFVMVGGIGFHLFALRFISKRKLPIFDMNFSLPAKKGLDKNLLQGSFIFGLGWGLAGYCPGPALVSLSSLDIRPIIFTVFMILGFFLFEWQESQKKSDASKGLKI